jgi:hypothetical protein
MSAAEMIVAAFTRYLEVGLGVAIAFALVVGRVEPSARGGSLLFRLLIVPGATLLWPLVLLRSVRAQARSLRARALPAKEQRS